MSLPNNIASVRPVLGIFLPPDNEVRQLLFDYELGGIALNDASQGLEYQTWTISYNDPDVIATPNNGSGIVLFSLAGITEVSLAFDQNMAPFVAYVVNSEAWYWWWDPTVPGQIHTQMASGVITPRCSLDDKRPSQTAVSDIILAYIRSGSLYYRQQRDRYTIEYLLGTGALAALNRIGMADNLRFHFEYLDDSNAPPISVSPGEIIFPYWDNLVGNGWIDLSKTTKTTFEATFGVPVEGADFQSVKSIGGSSTPIASLVNTVNGGNKIQIKDSSDAANAIIMIVSMSGIILSSAIYSSGSDSSFLEIPTGSDYYIVTASDTGNALINKADTSAIDLTGSVPFLSVFGVELATPGVTTYQKILIIPAKGISIAFTIPIRSDVGGMVFLSIEIATITSSRTATVNQTVGDFDNGARWNWGLGGFIKGAINNPGTADIDLIPGETYILNIRNDTPAVSNWMSIEINYG